MNIASDIGFVGSTLADGIGAATQSLSAKADLTRIAAGPNESYLSDVKKAAMKWTVGARMRK
jgi:hypothetical protein